LASKLAGMSPALAWSTISILAMAAVTPATIPS
jgi:hypothetical protein